MLVAWGYLLLAAGPPADAVVLDHLLPRPRQVQLTGWRPLAGGLGWQGDAAVTQHPAVAWPVRHWATAPASAAAARLELRLDPSDLPVRPQAYRILPVANGLRLQAREVGGLVAAARTVAQLIAARGEPWSLPEVTVADWPELPERGFWGGDAASDLDWLAERKFNLVEVHGELGFAADGTPTASLKPALLEQARQRGIQIVPIIHHLEQLASTGLFRVHPELAGGAAHGGSTGQTLVQLDHPNLPPVITGWMTDLLRLPDVQALTVWLAEEGSGNALSDRTQDPFVYEARLVERCFAAAAVAAGKPQAQLRVLTTQASFPHNEAILAALAPRTAVIHYDGGRTYNSSRKPIMEPYFQPWAAAGHHLGVCPILTADWRGVAPWHGGEFIQQRCRNFAASGVQTLVGYATPARRFYDFLLEAAAQYAWNPAEPSPAEFARAYAVRHNLRDPAAFAEWATLTGPIGQDLYGSRVVVSWCYGSSIGAVARGALKFGEGVLAEYRDAAHLADNLTKLRRAATLAEQLGEPQLQRETAVLSGWTSLLEQLWQLNTLLPRAATLNPAERAQVGDLLRRFDATATATVAALNAWGLGVLAAGEPAPSRWEDTQGAIAKQATELAALGERLGFPDAQKAYRRTKVGGWKTADFDAGEARLLIDVTSRVVDAGTYEAEFQWTSGLLGLTVREVVLQALRGDDETTLRVLATDRHDSHCGAWNKDHLYRLPLPQVDPGTTYRLVVRCGAGDPRRPAADRTSTGDVYFAKLRPTP